MFRILSLAGGGLRGAYAIGFLCELEENIDGSLSDYFDLITGTSTGGITAAALSYGISAKDMRVFYEKNGSEIFRPRPKKKISTLSQCLYPLARKLVNWKMSQNLDHFFRSRYCSNMLEESMREGFGDDSMASVRKCRLLIPAVNLTDGITCVFRTPHLPVDRVEYDWKISDIIVSTTAAPTYFPHKTMPDGKSYVDGGLWANDPGLVAMAETARILRCEDGSCSNRSHGEAFDSGQIQMLSLGTGQNSHSLSPPGADAGVLYWAKRVVEVMSLLQVQGAQFPLKVALGDRYHHYDFKIKNKEWSLDNVEMIDELFELGREDGKKHYESLKDTFFSKKTTPYKPVGLGLKK